VIFGPGRNRLLPGTTFLVSALDSGRRLEMVTKQQREIDAAFQAALEELGAGTDTDIVIAVVSERLQIEPHDILEALAVIHLHRSTTR
jgi:hypothetical protein